MTTISLQVPEVHCDNCKVSIESAVSKLDGVQRVDVAVPDATVAIEYDEEAVRLDEIKTTIEDQGYAVFG